MNRPYIAKHAIKHLIRTTCKEAVQIALPAPVAKYISALDAGTKLL